MSWQEWLLFIMGVVEFFFIWGIYRDDHAIRKIEEQNLTVARESLEAQKSYLALRRRWYEARQKKSEKPVEANPNEPTS